MKPRAPFRNVTRILIVIRLKVTVVPQVKD
jgi:hypothetical protein